MSTACQKVSPDGSRSDIEADVLERQRSRERMRYVQPRNAGKVIAHDRYWTIQFLRLYLSRCDELAFESPREAYLLAQQAAELARRIRVGDATSEFGTPNDKLDGIVTALAIQVTCCCALGDLGAARLASDRAERGLGGRTASADAMAELRLRQAAMELLSGDVEASIEATDACLKICTDHHLPEAEADAIAMRGYLLAETEPRQSLFDLLEAVGTARDTARGSRTAHAALNHLIRVARDGQIALTSQESALRHVQRLKNEWKGTRTSARKLKPLWIEGLMLGNLRIDVHAKRQVGKARLGMRKLGLPVEFATASLDLADLHLRFDDPAAASDVLIETFESLQNVGGDDLVRRLAPFREIRPSESEIRRARGVLPPMPTRPGIVPSRKEGAESEVRHV